MESRCSNFSAQICRHGDYQLRLARSSAYVQAKVAPNLTKNLVKPLNSKQKGPKSFSKNAQNV